MKITTICKYVDQPMILNKLDKKMPALLIGTGGAFGVVNSVKSAQKDKKTAKQKFAQNVIIISSTIGASLLGTRGLKINGKKIVKGLMERVPLQIHCNNHTKKRKSHCQSDRIYHYEPNEFLSNYLLSH